MGTHYFLSLLITQKRGTGNYFSLYYNGTTVHAPGLVLMLSKINN